MKKLRFLKCLILIILTVFIILWVSCIVRCEILTLIYGDEIIDKYKNKDEINYWIDGYDWAKIISYSEDSAVVYYINGNSVSKIGSIVQYVKNDELWLPKYDYVETLWSTSGNASDIVWPYWHHCFMFWLK